MSATPKIPLTEPTDEMLEDICDAHWNLGSSGGKRGAVVINDVHAFDVINHVISGSIEHEGIEYGFVIENGNWNGTVVQEWGLADDVGSYDPGSPPEPIAFVPKRRDAATLRIYREWRKQKWFLEKERAYRYDRYFQPGLAVERHYRDWADSKGLEIGYLPDLPK